MPRRGPILFIFGCAAILFVVLLVYSCEAEADAAAAPARMRQTICQVFGARCATALTVAKCETGGTWNRWARGDDGERGLFQIHPVHFGWLDESRLYEVRYNARAAFRLSRGGRSWEPWTCQP
jgi:hypothetical protein